MKKITVFIALAAFMLLLVVSEVVYAANNKWVRYSYTLRIVKTLNKIGKTNIAFFVATQCKYKLPDSKRFRDDVNKDINDFSTRLNLPVLLYEFALSAKDNNLGELVPNLLQMSIKMDPDFSFWRVELANYYLLTNNSSLAKEILNNCLKVEAPRKHCQSYLDDNFSTGQPQVFGFLRESVLRIYELNPKL